MTSLATNDFRSAAGFMALQSLPRVGPVTALNATLHSTQMEQLLKRYGSEVDVAFERAQRRLADYADADVRLVSFFDRALSRSPAWPVGPAAAAVCARRCRAAGSRAASRGCWHA